MDAHVTEPAARNALIGALAVWFLLLVVSTGIALATALRINLSGSLPIGLYRLVPGEIEHGSLAVVCPEPTNPAIHTALERNYLELGGLDCKGGVKPLLKQVLALPGDQVAVSQDGIQVNGQKIENSARLASDSAGRLLSPLPASGAVPAGHVWLFSGQAPESFDSRYFGPVIHSAIVGKAAPVWVFGY